MIQWFNEFDKNDKNKMKDDLEIALRFFIAKTDM